MIDDDDLLILRILGLEETFRYKMLDIYSYRLTDVWERDRWMKALREYSTDPNKIANWIG